MSTSSPVATVLYEVVAKEMNTTVSAVEEATSLQDLGVDSLEMIEIVMNVEDRLGIAINDRELREVTSMPELLALIERSPKKVQA